MTNELAAIPRADVDDVNSRVIVVDALGQMFQRILDSRFRASLAHPDEIMLGRRRAFSRAAYAVYGRVDWRVAAELASRGPTLIVARDYHREDALEALRSGLIGYIDLSMSPITFGRAVRKALFEDQADFVTIAKR